MAIDERYEIERLRRQLEEVTIERDRLLAENHRLARFLNDSRKSGAVSGMGITGVSEHPTTVLTPINHGSLLQERVHLFRSFFRGREDVFPRLWQNKRTLRMGYSPVCTREWNPIYCDKPRVKCGDCPNRNFAPMTDDVIRQHLEGNHIIGLYPLLPEETCYLLAIDFDKQSWMEDAAAFMETCNRLDVPAALERSRSGNGAHIWVFFSEAVSASSARKLGCYLLTETMVRRHQLGMDSYDRLFPNQDTLPKGGFGNLIALPFQKGPGQQGNTKFVDQDFEPYQDQWAFLYSLRRIGSSALNEFAREAVRRGQVLGVRVSPTDEENQPWTILPSKRIQEPLLDGPFPDQIDIVVSNLVYVEKAGLSSSLLNRIKRLAAFQNPDFYKRQTMRLSTALTPRVIACAEEYPKYLGLPRGCLKEIQQVIKSVGIMPKIVDKRVRGTKIEAAFHGQLTPAQAEATKYLLRHDNGVLVAPSGSGKTVLGIYMIAARKTNTLVLVHRRPILEQWRTQIASFTKVDLKTIGQIGVGQRRRSGVIDVAMLQSLVRKGQIEDLVAEYGQVIVDECHHLPAVTFEHILRQVKARYVLGLTATPYRRDGHHPIILMQCGPIRHIMSQKDQGSLESLQHRLICRYTNFELPAQESDLSINDIYSALITDEERNQLIVNDVLLATAEGRSPIVLTERREHLKSLAARLAESVHNVIILHGGMGTNQQREIEAQLATIPDGEARVMVATGRYAGEGFDDVRLDTLFLTMPVSWKGTLVQYAGRLHRLHSGKKEVRIYDYVDDKNPALLRMFRKRLRGYRSLGYEPDIIESQKLLIED